MLIRFKAVRAVVAAALIAVASIASAGPLILSGDSNILDHLGSNPGNARFFDNILGASSTVGVLSTTPSLCCLGNLDTDLVGYYTAKPGVTASLLAGPITGAGLAGLNLLAIIAPETAFTGSEIAAISAFLSGGGTLFVSGDNNGFPGENANVNALLTGLGSGMQIQNDLIDAGFNTAVIDAHPLTVGTARFDYAATSQVIGGTSLYRTETGNVTFIAVEDVNAVPEPMSLALLGLGVGALALRRRS